MKLPPRSKQRPHKRKLNIKEFLLAEEPRFEDIVPERGHWKSRPAIEFGTPEFQSSESQDLPSKRKEHG